MSDKGMVVVGVDGSDHAGGAVHWGAALAARFGGSLHLVHVMRAVDEALLTITTAEQEDVGAHPRQLGQAVLDRAADAVRADFPGLRISRTLSHRRAAEVLTELSTRARVVVLACAEVSPAGALAVGSTTLTVAAHSSCPVIAWRGDAPAPTGASIVVGVDDGHETSRAALVTAFGLADRLKVPLVAVHAVPERRSPGEINIPIVVDHQALEKEALQRLSVIVAPIADQWPQVDVSCAAGTGKASRVLVEHADGAQLIVVGHRGRGNVASALLGSTGLGLLHHSTAPVVMCPSSYVWDELPLADGKVLGQANTGPRQNSWK